MPHQCTTCGNVFEDGSKEMLSGCPECGGNKFQFHPKGTDVPADPPDETPPESEGSTTANTVGRAATKVRDFVSRDDGPQNHGPRNDGPQNHGPRSDDPGATPRTAAGTPSGTSTDGPDPNAAWPSEEESENPPASGGDDSDIIDADAREAARGARSPEDGAQTAARDELASSDEVSAGGAPPDAPDSGPVGSTGPDADGLAGAEHAARRGGGDDADAGAAGSPSGGPSPDDGRVVSEPSQDQPDISELRRQLNDQFESIKILEPGQYELNLMELYDREEYIIALQENGRYVIQVPEQWLGDQPGA